MSVNVAALVTLLIGVLYLGQYQDELIEAKLETFQTKVELIAIAIAESSLVSESEGAQSHKLSAEKALSITQRFEAMTDQKIYVFDREGRIVSTSSSSKALPQNGQASHKHLHAARDFNIAKVAMRWVSKITPQPKPLPLFPSLSRDTIGSHPDVALALDGYTSFSAWHDENKTIILAASMPVVVKNSEHVGAVFIMRPAYDIEDDIQKVWRNILLIFLGTLVLTVLLSIYLSGLIARPLMKLARAAENVRRDRGHTVQIPDLSDRYDEIGELSIALRSMTEALRERMGAIESFAADVAHELKNPLASLRSATETLDIVKTKKDKGKLMHIIQHDLDRLERLINDVSEASRLDSELPREAIERVDIHQFLYDLMDVYKDPLERAKPEHTKDKGAVMIDTVRVCLDVSDSKPLYVPAIPSRLFQVFENLIANAVSFSPAQGSITIKTLKVNGQAHIQVIDEGPGIPEDNLESIFKRFYTERPENEGYGQHSGLGLSICREIIEAFNGQIFASNVGAQNNRGGGAIFTIILPILSASKNNR